MVSQVMYSVDSDAESRGSSPTESLQTSEPTISDVGNLLSGKSSPRLSPSGTIMATSETSNAAQILKANIDGEEVDTTSHSGVAQNIVRDDMSTSPDMVKDVTLPTPSSDNLGSDDDFTGLISMLVMRILTEIQTPAEDYPVDVTRKSQDLIPKVMEVFCAWSGCSETQAYPENLRIHKVYRVVYKNLLEEFGSEKILQQAVSTQDSSFDRILVKSLSEALLHRCNEALRAASRTERRLVKNPELAEVHNREIHNLVKAGLSQPENEWPTAPRRTAPPQPTEAYELRRSAQCYSISTEPTTALPDLTQSQTLPDLITATNQTSDGVASIPTSLAAETLLQQAQAVSFPEELKALKAGREVAKDSRLLSLALEYDPILGVIRVGGRLRQAEVLDPDAIHPIIIDSKPLGYLSADIADPDPVTPNMLLMGRRDASLPQAMYADTNLVGRRGWRHSKILADHFWARFIRDYLPSLQHRGKWRREMASLETGQVVMMVDPQLPRASWPVGRITKTMPGTDGRVRSVKNRTYIRPVARLIPLPEMTEDGEQ
ncbi:uncharacterized protein LOC118947730 [Oncorhynchus mykiss]|uniref:uncharacterized protein LOC118947730 n=1 Tax=Oncorhynchus mykiss TaxID=8022 RepID=UPI001877BB01|nr:uncharacterized protein LOC118947730 [Oncorhynchus mykiss]